MKKCIGMKRFWDENSQRAILVATLNIFVLSSFAAADFSKTQATEIYETTKVDAITSTAYALGNANANLVMQNKNGDAQVRVGNVMKLMTLYLTFEAIGEGKISLDTQFEVSVAAQKISEGRARVFLDGYKHEKITVKQAIEAVCIASANDAAYVLAEGLGGTEQNFVAMMNAKAAELGMKNTLYTDSTGIAKDQYTSANDLAVLACDLLNKYPSVTDYTKLTYGLFKHESTQEGDTEMVSSNNLTRGKFYQQSDGLLVGSDSEFGYAMVGTVADESTRSVAVIVGAADENYRAAEIRTLLEYGLTAFEYRQIETKGTFVRKINIKDGKEKKIKTEAAADFSVLLNKDDFDKIEKKVEITKTVQAPAKKGETVGEIVYMLEEKELGRVEIVLSEDMEKAGWFTRLIRKILSFSAWTERKHFNFTSGCGTIGRIPYYSLLGGILNENKGS